MATVTKTKLGPADHGRPMTFAEYMAGDYEEGYKYELIDGRLYVSPLPDLPQNQIQEWINDQLKKYAWAHPEIINYVSSAARVFVPGQPGTTTPQPDQAAFHDFPVHLPRSKVDWRDVSPVLVIEILSDDDPEKDLVRNVELYLRVPSIKEYWLFDMRQDADRPSMLVYRKSGKKWRAPLRFAYGDTYTTRLLPEFVLKLDPRR